MFVPYFIYGLVVAAGLVSAEPDQTIEDRAFKTATVVLPLATVLGNVKNRVESFGGIPYAEPPEGPLRLRPPKRLARNIGRFDGTGPAGACPQMGASSEDAAPALEFVADLLNTPFFQKATGQSEDCLSITVARPEGTKADAKLPVLFWIYGGGYQFGWSSSYDGTSLVKYGVEIGKPFVFVAVNYRVNAYGFLPGKEVQADGAGNLGLLDQRMGLEWVADNIAAFGGDPDKVTIWGESAGAMSVFSQMLLFDGNNTYNGRPLFRGGILNSGSIIPAEPLGGTKGQAIYDQVVRSAGCAGSKDSLNCLRGLDYDTFLRAATSVPSLVGYTSLAVSYLPRPDGRVLTDSPEALIAAGKYAAVPVIIGTQEDEGTLFGLFQPNITTKARLANYLGDLFFSNMPASKLTEFVDMYGSGFSSIIRGAPFRTGLLNEIMPGFKRRAAVLGDLVITLPRRLVVETMHALKPEVRAWSFLASYNHGTPVIGTTHATDLLQIFYGIKDNYAARSMRSYMLNFVYDLDPNVGRDGRYPYWPTADTNQLLQLFAKEAKIIKDDFRMPQFEWLKKNLANLRY